MTLLLALALLGATPPSLVGTPTAPPPANVRAAVLREACDSGETAFRAPRYPPEEVRRQIEGTVGLMLLTNACGQVRHAWVTSTSGNRNLDASAMSQALRWRIAPFPNRPQRGYWSIDITYDMPANPFDGGHSIRVDPAWVTLGTLEPFPSPP